jgi:hypothetical protein
MSVAHLDSPVELFQRLLDFQLGKRDPSMPREWLFRIDGRAGYFRPWAEGDDFLAHVAGWRGIAVGADASAVPRCASAMKTLESLGLDASYYLRTAGRAEFVGVHMLVERGLMTPGVWCPDVTRGLVKSAVGLSAKMREDDASCYMTRALAIQTRAMMFAGRVQPLQSMYEAWAQDCVARAGAHERRFTMAKLDWQAAMELGETYGASVNCGAIIARLQAQASPLEFPSMLQQRLVEASVEGPISAQEWSVWSMGGVTLETDDLDFFQLLPRSVQNKLLPPS